MTCWRGWWGLGAFLCWTVSACAEDDGLDVSNGCDIRSSACQRAVFETAMDVRGDPFASRPPVRTIDLQAFADEVNDALNEAMQDEESSTPHWSVAMQLLGLLSPDNTLREASVAHTIDSVAAYYDSEDKSVTVVDRGDEKDMLSDTFVLAHEYIHALQDQQLDLRSFREAWVDSSDSSVSIRTLTEGEAMVLGGATVEELMGPNWRLDWTKLRTSVDESAIDAIDEADEPWVSVTRELPYALGLSELMRYRPLGSTPNEIGFLYEDPPRAMLEWLDSLWSFMPGASSIPSGCYPTAAPAGYHGVDHDTLGALGLMTIELVIGQRARDAMEAARDWVHDTMVVFEDDAGGGETAVAWRIRLESTAAAQQLATRASVLGIDVIVVGGGLPSDGEEVLLYAATDPSVAAGWSEVSVCGTEQDLPEPETSMDAMMNESR